MPAVAGYGAYTHFWPNRFRSIGTVGYGRVDTSEQQPASSFLDSYDFAANLLWNAVASLNVDVEYLYGTHSVESGDNAHASPVQISAKYGFFRKRPFVP